MPSCLRCPLVALLAVLGSTSAFADRLVTHDGRVLDVKKARLLPDGSYRLEFENGAIVCPAQFVASVEIEGDMSDYVPQNADEQKKLEQGYVKYRGKWLLKATYQAELGRQAEANRARTTDLALHAEFHSGWTRETKHFLIQSNTSPELLEHYAELLESYYDLMDQRVGIKPSPTLRRTKMQVNIYKSMDEFLKLTKMPRGVGGFFSFQDEELQFFHDYEEPELSEWVALHEGTHLLTYLIEPQSWPLLWVNEGVADYFGSANISRDKKGKLKIEPGRLQIDRILTVQQALQEQKTVPLEKLFGIEDQESFTAFEYAHAWSFIYFLNNSEYEKGFKRFFKDFYTIPKTVSYRVEEDFPNQQGSAKIIPPAEVRRLLLEKLGVKDLPRLEKQWLDFTAAIEIDAPRARLKRGLNTLYDGKKEELPQALEDIEAAIAAGIEDPQAYWARGVLRLIQEGGRDKCAADFHKAIELAPLSAGLRNSLAQLQGGMSLHTPGLTVSKSDEPEQVSGSDEALNEAKEQFGLACELEPENDYYKESRAKFLELYERR